jgi:phosphate transport system substrate-binding protein
MRFDASAVRRRLRPIFGFWLTVDIPGGFMKCHSVSCGLLAALILICSNTSCSPQSNKGGSASEVKLHGSGASFPAPLYNKWFKEYGTAHPDVQVDYQSTGSGQGVTAVIDKTVDFGASDKAMKQEEMDKVEGGVQLLPMTAGSIVLAFSVPDVDDLKLSREAYAGIFLGKVAKWNDPAIVKTNPGAKLTDMPINVIVRADSSGTTAVFTKHLSAISKEFAANPGENAMPNWPVGTKSKGNEGITSSLTTTPGSIGYLEYGYAIKAKLHFAKLENKAGKFIEPTIASAQATLESIEMPANLIAWAPDPEGAESYPIVTYTWIMLYKQYPDAAKAKALKDVLTWCLGEGQKQSEVLGYIPLPEPVAEKAKAALGNIEAGGGSDKKSG